MKNCNHKIYLFESLLWSCFIDDDGALECKNKENEIKKIKCVKCGKTFKVDSFKEINFN